MKKIIFTLLAITLLFSCKDDELTSQEQLDFDINLIETYLSDNGITAIKDVSGVFYVIEDEGTGTTYPTTSNIVSLAYEGRLMEDESVFDSATSTNPLKTELYNLISGWQIGIPKFKEGGIGTLYIPSAYAYGTTAVGTAIPANSVLIFDIELLDFN